MNAIMRVLALAWVGTRTTDYAATLAFFKDVLGLNVHSSQTDFAVLDVPAGKLRLSGKNDDEAAIAATVELFGPTSRYNQHLTHPVAGVLVSDLKTAVAELQAAGVEIVLPVQHGELRSWMHLRAPDGFVYELVEDSSAAPTAADATGKTAAS